MEGRRFRQAGLLVGMLLGGMVLPVQAFPEFETRDPSLLSSRGADVGTAMLVEFYDELAPYAEDDSRTGRSARIKALSAFKKKVAARYTEGTLQRLLNASKARARRAAVLSLGMMGTMRSNANVAALLHDDDQEVRLLSANALWSIWFRADSEVNNQELQRLAREPDPQKALAGLNPLIQKAPAFAEAYNQRAIVWFRLEEYSKSVADCEMVLKLNPYHFGALSGLAQCWMKLKKPGPALTAFRSAYQINPGLEGVSETIRALEDVLGEDGKK